MTKFDFTRSTPSPRCGRIDDHDPHPRGGGRLTCPGHVVTECSRSRCDDCGDVLTTDTESTTCLAHRLCIACDFDNPCRQCAREKREAMQ